MRHINQAGLEIIKEFEGLFLTAYKDPIGIPTVGWGHTATVLKEDVGKKIITEHDAEDLLKLDLLEAEKAVTRLCKVPITDNQYSALVSWTFNLGQGNLASSTMLKRINQNMLETVPFEMQRWNRAGGQKLPGLVRRRKAEADLFASDFSKKNISVEALKNL